MVIGEGCTDLNKIHAWQNEVGINGCSCVPEGMIIASKLCEQGSKGRRVQLDKAPFHSCNRARLQGQTLNNPLQLCCIGSFLHADTLRISKTWGQVLENSPLGVQTDMESFSRLYLECKLQEF